MSDHMILNAVVASDKTNGIGFTEAQYGNANVSLPWKLDGEFKYFMDVCTYNKVWDSLIINVFYTHSCHENAELTMLFLDKSFSSLGYLEIRSCFQSVSLSQVSESQNRRNLPRKERSMFLSVDQKFLRNIIR